jgi:hypothetical protein
MTPPCSPVFPAPVIARLDSKETHRPFDADEEDRRNDEDDEQEELERQKRQDEEDSEDIHSDDVRGNFVRPALPMGTERCRGESLASVIEGAERPGPILSLLASRSFDLVVLFSTPNTEERTGRTASLIQGPDTRIRFLPLAVASERNETSVFENFKMSADGRHGSPGDAALEPRVPMQQVCSSSRP